MKLVLLLWISALAVLAGGGWLLCPDGVCSVPLLDREGLRLAHDLRGPGLDGLMGAATWLGSFWLLLPLLTLAGLGVWRHDRRMAAFPLLSLLGATALAHLFKLAVERPRPDLYAVLGHIPLDASYPSAHTMQAVAVALSLAALAGSHRVYLAPFLLALAVLVAWSRLHLQVHFASDVLFGAVAAGLWVAGLHRLLWRTPPRSGV